jgi:hypothetical protein
LEDANTVTQNGTGWGAGLRQHHFNAGAPADSNGEFCVTCHADADPANFTTAGEDTMPPWYGSVLNTNLDLNLEPCNPGGEENLAGLAIGLDNDGDLLYDTADPDCQDPCGNGIIDPGEDCDPNFPNTECCNPDCTFAGAGTACGDPNVTECDLADTCDGAGTCQINYEPAGTTCGDPSDTDCDNPDTCDGMGGCLPNYETAGFACGDPADTQCDNPDTCDDVGVCLINNESDGTTCDDSNACTANDTCGGGSCQPGTLDCSQPNCDGTVDPRCALGCSGETDPDAFCQAQDGLFCNGLETCNLSSDQCEAGPPPNCDDGVACTIDSCDEVNDQCVNAPDNTACDDGNVCTTDVCDPILGCQNTPNTDPCDDGDFCTENDVCGGGTCAGTPKNCDDGSFCTGIETCSPVDGSCVSPGDPCTGQTVCNEGTDSCDAVTCVDNDNDGYGDPGDPSCLNGGQRDCDDTNASVNPGAMEVCDGLDTNCDNFQSPTDVDADGDGKAVCAGDCNDNDPTVYPGITTASAVSRPLSGMLMVTVSRSATCRVIATTTTPASFPELMKSAVMGKTMTVTGPLMRRGVSVPMPTMTAIRWTSAAATIVMMPTRTTSPAIRKSATTGKTTTAMVSLTARMRPA